MYEMLEWFLGTNYDDVIKWKHFPRNWPFVRKIHRSPVNFPHKGQWRGALMFSLIYVWINDWANNREAGDLRRYPVHYDVIVMLWANDILRDCRLTHCGLAMPYDDVDLSQNGPGNGFTWTNVDLSFVRSSDIHLTLIAQKIHQPSITKISMKLLI